MRGGVLGVERRRRWSDEDKLSIVSSVGIDGATVTQVACRCDVNRAAAARCECPSSTNATTRSRSAIGCGLPISNLHICHADREPRIWSQGNPESERSQRALGGSVHTLFDPRKQFDPSTI
jgi:hypothetical protein